MMGTHRFRIVSLLAIILLFSGSIVAHRFSAFYETHQMYQEFTRRTGIWLMKGLVSEHHLPTGNSGRLPDALLAYILGGTQESLGYKWKTVGKLYSEGTVRKILILHRPGITEFSPGLGRNLTNDEWVIGKLKEEGVAFDAVEFVPVPAATFGTLAEARVISALARSRRVKRLVLVSSTHHTKRVWLSFSHFNADNAFEPYTYGSEERAGIFELLMETMKLGLYKYFVFPIDRLRGDFRR